MKIEQNLNEAYQELSEMIAVNPEAFNDRYLTCTIVSGQDGREVELIIRATPRSHGKEYATQGVILTGNPITLKINTLTRSASFQHRDLSSDTLETTATEAIQDFAEAMTDAIDKAAREDSLDLFDGTL